jgi:hypothetical protein
MKKLTLTLVIVALIATGCYLAYRIYFPEFIAQSIVSEESPAYVPRKMKTTIQKIKKPVNEGAHAVITTMHKSGITIDQILKAIDNAREEQAYAMLDELNNTEIKDPNQVFDMAKKHFPVDFNVEVFRKPFNEKVSLRLIKKGIRYANIYRDEEKMDAQTAKAIVKKILLQKEKDLSKILQ